MHLAFKLRSHTHNEINVSIAKALVYFII